MIKENLKRDTLYCFYKKMQEDEALEHVQTTYNHLSLVGAIWEI